MKPSDVCRQCDGVGRLVDMRRGVIQCPVCLGSGWDPVAVKREVDAQKNSIEDVKL